MKRLLLAATALVMLSAPAFAAETYTFDPNHTNIIWHANHFGFSNPSGRFGVKEGTVTLDEKTPANSAVNVTIDVKGLTTGIAEFDQHLKAEGFLNADKFPEATFKSTKVEVAEGGQAAKVIGDLTLHGVTKPVTLDVKLNKIGENPMNKKKSAGFSATTTIKRSDFGIDKYVPAVSDELQIGIEAEAAIQ